MQHGEEGGPQTPQSTVYFQKRAVLLERLLGLAGKEHADVDGIARDYLPLVCEFTERREAALTNGGPAAWLWDNLEKRLSGFPATDAPPGLDLPLEQPSGVIGKFMLPSCVALADQEMELAGLIASAAARALDRYQALGRAHRASERDRDELLEHFLSGGSIDNTLQAIATLIGRHLAGCKGSVLALDGGAVECVAAPDLPAEYRTATSSLRAVPPSGDELSIAVRAAAALRERAPHVEVAAELGYPYFEAVPLVSRSGEMLGLLLAHCAERPDDRVAESLRGLAGFSSLVMEHRRLAISAAWAASHDALTGLGNREALHRALRDGLARMHRSSSLALIFISLDRFRSINGSLGHTAGDLALRRTAERIVSTLGDGQTAMRPGGDEFAVLVTGRADQHTVTRLAETIYAEISSPFKIEGHQVRLACSIGISIWPGGGKDAESLLRNAEIAASRAREKDGPGIVVHSRDLRPARFVVERGLESAIAQNEMELRYQPVVTMDGTITGFEVLLGWNHPEFGQIPANHFIPIAEEADLIVPIGEWVLRRVCEQAFAWRAAKGLRYWVNASARQFARSAFADTVRDAVAKAGIEGSCLVLELTETTIMRDVEECRTLMNDLRKIGVRLAIDDFGSGYSSLNYLWSLPVQAIKIDQSFVRDLSDSARALAIMETLVGLGHTLGLDVVAEGVESEAQFEIVRGAGCDFAQGYLFASPMGISDAEALISSL